MRIYFYTERDDTKWSSRITNQRVSMSNYNRIAENTVVENFAKRPQL